ncbi:2-C-methyl-D-erythritol 2,4-cyclodiphosphate synthase [bacterium]|nr:2-C-methyl-D-erythritol 2,4-cyclodiphosphate synthase [bacterium]
MSDSPPFAVGFGYDVHRFAEGRRLVLGGVEIRSDLGLLGHSDADVLLHAVCDALLGAAALGDIGHFFPNDDPKWKDADSRVLLREVRRQMTVHGWSVGNVDATLVAERPKIAPHIDAMRAIISEDLGIPPYRIGIKATTNEGMGFVGRGEGIAAMATALLFR